MTFSGHLTTSKRSKLSKMPSLLHQCSLTLISPSQPACAQMLVDMAWALYSNRTQQVHRTSFRLDPDSLLTLKPIMQLLNLKCLPYAGLSTNASFSFQGNHISQSSQTTTPLFPSLTIIALMKSKTHIFKDLRPN